MDIVNSEAGVDIVTRRLGWTLLHRTLWVGIVGDLGGYFYSEGWEWALLLRRYGIYC